MPHTYLITDISVKSLIEFIDDINSRNTNNDITMDDLFIKAAGKVCAELPDSNSQWNGTSIRSFKNANVSFVVSTGNGYVTPTVPQADSLTISKISQIRKNLVQKVKDDKLEANDTTVC